MKKFFLLLATCLVIASCEKENINTTIPSTVTISFKQQVVSSNSMVRSTSNEFLDIIEEQTPKSIDVILTNIDLNQTYACKSDECITVPLGTYEIYAYSDNNNDICHLGGNMYSRPTLDCSDFTVTVDQDTKTIALNTYYNCYAVFAPIDECERCYSGETDVDFYKQGNYHVAYFHTGDVQIILTPYSNSTDFLQTSYNFTTILNNSKINAEYGKYYVVHPQKIDKTDSSFEINIENMEEGKI